MSQPPPGGQPNPYAPNQYGAGAQPPPQPHGPPQYGSQPPGAYQQSGPNPPGYQQGGPQPYQQGGPQPYQQGGPNAYQQGGAYQPGGFGGGMPQQQKRRPPWLLALVGGAVLLALIGIIAALLISNSSNPEKTVRDLVTAANANDCEAALKLVTENLPRSAVCKDLTPDTAALDILALKTTEYGDNATVFTTIRYGSEIGEVAFTLVRKGGKWLVDTISSLRA